MKFSEECRVKMETKRAEKLRREEEAIVPIPQINRKSLEISRRRTQLGLAPEQVLERLTDYDLHMRKARRQRQESAEEEKLRQSTQPITFLAEGSRRILERHGRAGSASGSPTPIHPFSPPRAASRSRSEDRDPTTTSCPRTPHSGPQSTRGDNRRPGRGPQRPRSAGRSGRADSREALRASAQEYWARRRSKRSQSAGRAVKGQSRDQICHPSRDDLGSSTSCHESSIQTRPASARCCTPSLFSPQGPRSSSSC